MGARINFTDTQESEIVSLYEEEHLPCHKIAKKYSCSTRPIIRVLKEKGIVLDVAGRRVIHDSEGRICARCNLYKEWKNFRQQRNGLRNRSPYCKGCESKQQRKRNFSIAEKVFSHYGTTCIVCGESDTDILCLDHIDNNGGWERKQPGRLYDRLLRENYPLGYQVLCCNHNWKKEILRRRGESWTSYVRLELLKRLESTNVQVG